MPRIRSENSKIKYRYRNERRIILRKNLFALAAWNASRPGQKESASKQLLVIAGQRINVVSGLLFLPPMLVRARRLFQNLSLNIAGDRHRDSPWDCCGGRGDGFLEILQTLRKSRRSRKRESSILCVYQFRSYTARNIWVFQCVQLRETLRSSLNNR